MAIDRGQPLLAIARDAIAEQLEMEGPPPPPPPEGLPWLQEPGATFVTLKLRGELRGCIGTLRPRRSLQEDVACNARAAAFQDSRFPPLSREEFLQTEIEVSLLSPLETVPFESQAQLLSQLRPGVDGLVLEWGHRRGTFLPQVWEQLPDPKAFLAHLKQKAGLHPDFWDDGIQVARFTVTKWREARAVGHAHG